VEMARTYLELADQDGARTMLREIDGILRHRPQRGTVPGHVADLRAKVASSGHDVQGASSLTAAELRVLPMLTTHLTFKEIGERLFLSRHTVKSHAMSIYRKLGASSRSAAVQQARDVGLL
jgi:LuxR family maltose regulon positive regulatory protein